MVTASPTRIAPPWFIRARPDSDARLRLFCFPYAGGGAAIFIHTAESVILNMVSRELLRFINSA